MRKFNKILFFILLFSLIIRLYHITFPVSGWHAWRQADTAAIARNFYENGFKLFFPQVDWGGASPGYVESEFQLFPFITALLYAIFGISDTWGRILSLIFSLFTIYGLYVLVRSIISEETAIWSAAIYSILPLNIYYGRAFMPESAMLMCSVYGIYFFYQWIVKEKTFSLYVSAVFIALAVLLKLPCLYLGLPLFYFAFTKYKFNAFKKIQLWIYVIIIFLPSVLWYWHAHHLFTDGGVTFTIWKFGEDKWGTFGLLLDPAFYNKVFLGTIAERHLLYPGFIVCIWGLFIKRGHNYEKVFDYWLIAVLFFILFVSQGNLTQEYYQLPLTLPAVVFIAKVFAKYLKLSRIKDSFEVHKVQFIILILCLILLPVLSYLRYSNFMRSEKRDSPLFMLTDDTKTLSSQTDLVVTASNNPVYLYLSHRKGWAVSPEQLDTVFVEQKRIRGAKWLIGESSEVNSDAGKKNLDAVRNRYRVIRDDKGYFIFKLENEK